MISVILLVNLALSDSDSLSLQAPVVHTSALSVLPHIQVVSLSKESCDTVECVFHSPIETSYNSSLDLIYVRTYVCISSRTFSEVGFIQH